MSRHRAFIACLAIFVLGGSFSSVLGAGPRVDLNAMLARRVPILLEFGRGWCIPCKYMKPILADTARTYGNRVIVTAVDMDANRDLVRKFRIRLMPTQVFLTPDGREFFRNEGTLERARIMKILGRMGVSPPATAGRGR